MAKCKPTERNKGHTPEEKSFGHQRQRWNNAMARLAAIRPESRRIRVDERGFFQWS